MDKSQDKLNKKREELDDRLKELEQITEYKNKKNKLLFPTFTKNLVALVIFVCLIDLQFTYVLAFLDRASTVETLSQSLCTTILGVAFVYMIRAYFDSKAEYGNSKDLKEELSNFKDGKIRELIDNAINKINEESQVPIDGDEFKFTDDFNNTRDDMQYD